ncbi:hypothetical protein AYO21_01099 [Fonsecaea monophora]|uniref:Uncharacterized protein n=1 Tax=Fonsecaea monophora TaxID=254056 RepID=A0A177FN69_9EURO|nr:hypothetical protein AYO21_01099 [Fonsecaea monophora]KAH0841667.1 hypothetical protein FOPE_06889 [Fonsecaea pedrosoi]OAG44609.1 hypothetical protein AYO21_01099 [Fonsecaea monophora]
MFEVPDAKRVKRSDLFRDDHNDDDVDDTLPGSRGSSRSVSPCPTTHPKDDGENVLRPSYGFEYEFVAPPTASSPEQKRKAKPGSDLRAPTKPESKSAVNPKQEGEEEEGEEEPLEFQFRLFTSSKKSRSTTNTSAARRPSQDDVTTTTTTTTTTIADTRIRLSRTPEPAALEESLSLENAHFLRPHRPDSYYFTAALPEEATQALRTQYADVAVSTADILSRATRTKWPGTALPWRLIHVQLLHGKDRSAGAQPLRSSTSSSSSGSKRPSKKRRILLRRRLALRQELAAQAKATEETEREKRTRRNREKKVKRKEREKRKKVEVEEGGQEGEGEGEGKAVGGGGGGGHDDEEGKQDVLPHVRPHDLDEKSGAQVATQADSKGPATKVFALASTHLSVASASAPASAPVRRAPTSRAPTATAVHPKSPKPIHPTRTRL